MREERKAQFSNNSSPPADPAKPSPRCRKRESGSAPLPDAAAISRISVQGLPPLVSVCCESCPTEARWKAAQARRTPEPQCPSDTQRPDLSSLARKVGRAFHMGSKRLPATTPPLL